jgi:hypothetical protein
VFGRRKRQEAEAAEAAREAERRALFAKLAERPEHICPFLGLAGERAGYVEGVSDEHRCFAFGEPAPLSAEQQTRVCQERGYGNCPRYLRGVLVIPTEELEALRRPRPAAESPMPAPSQPAPKRRRRAASPILLLVAAVVLLVGGVGAYLLFGPENGVSVIPSATASPTAEPTAIPTEGATAEPTATIEPTPTPTTGTGPATPTPEPTPEPGDAFASYEVAVGPEGYTLYSLDGDGDVTGTREASFGNFSHARAEPREGDDGRVYWETQVGGLEGWSYRSPDSGDFRVRAVFLNDDGERRSEFLPEDELTEMPEATPAP